MKDLTIQSAPSFAPSPLRKEKPDPPQGQTSFVKILKDSIKEVNRIQDEADKAVQELALGEKRDVHQTIIALEKADISFQLMMQVRNKIIAAYEEIMRMQV